MPVAFAPGRARLATRPRPTGSATGVQLREGGLELRGRAGFDDHSARMVSGW
jgi:hypothetical protein